jgi:hypothetical protein
MANVISDTPIISSLPNEHLDQPDPSVKNYKIILTEDDLQGEDTINLEQSINSNELNQDTFEDGEEFRAKEFAKRAELSKWFPQINLDENKSWRIWISKRSRALIMHTSLVTAILVTNFALTLFGMISYPGPHGIGTIYQGDCNTVKRLDLWLHLLINLLSTGLLMASNYCMQLQAAPTRADIDRAHARGQWLDIGVPSLRNFGKIGRWRKFTWLLLAFSSLPIHFM